MKFKLPVRPLLTAAPRDTTLPSACFEDLVRSWSQVPPAQIYLAKSPTVFSAGPVGKTQVRGIAPPPQSGRESGGGLRFRLPFPYVLDRLLSCLPHGIPIAFSSVLRERGGIAPGDCKQTWQVITGANLTGTLYCGLPDNNCFVRKASNNTLPNSRDHALR